ncbi:MAG: peptide MFS transporter [Bryobacterales bacterium]|nr:peptide MFS transporter [Bryobacterales bacterium]
MTSSAAASGTGFGGHPSGLATLFFVEMWERFSYYGMRAILVLYCVAAPAIGGLGFSTQDAASLYGTYTMAVYLLSVPGGLIADRWLGARRSVLLGGIVIIAGQFTLTVASLPFFYTGLSLIAIGTGLLKPNISTMVGSLYSKDDPRRDSGFSLFYMGINVGAVMAPLVCGYLAESPAFKAWLAGRGFDPAGSWQWGFAAAGVGMIAGLLVFLLRRGTLSGVGERPAVRKKATSTQVSAVESHGALTGEEWKRIFAISILFAFTILFWSAYEQKGASLNLFAKQLVSTSLFGWEFPASWLQSLTPFYVILLAPVFARMWIRMGDRQPSSPAKFALGLLAIGLAFCLLVPASALTAAGKISPLWLAAVYLLDVIGELCLSPVGLSTVTKVAPIRLVGLMMGAWFFAASLGNKLAGYFSTFFVADDPNRLVWLYGSIAAGLLLGAGLLFLLTGRLRRLMGEENGASPNGKPA